MTSNHSGLISQPADDRPRDLYAGAVLATFAPRAPRHRKAPAPRWLPVAIGGLLLVSLFVLVGCNTTHGEMRYFHQVISPPTTVTVPTRTPDDPANASAVGGVR